MKPKVLVTRKIPDQGLNILYKECEVELNPHDKVMSKKEIIKRLKDKDGLLCLLTDTIDAEVINSNPNLKMIANYAVGYNNIDVKAATEKRIPVSNTPGVLTETTADLAFSLLMCTARRIAESDRYTRQGKFKGWEPMLFLGGDIYNKTLGIIGMGRIGQAITKRAKGFNMEIIYYDIQKNENIQEANYVNLKTLLTKSDFVTIHVPLTEKTKHLISEKELSMMKPTAYLINTSRGPVVDEKALTKALKEKKIAGAGLDVYEEEPKLHPGLTKLENVVLAPHIGSASLETRGKMAEMAATNLIAGLKKQKIPNIVNPEIYK